jgi:heme oxygenase
MSLKELTAEKHREAESTLFMKAVFDRNLPYDLWIDWTFQKTLFYTLIEGAAAANRMLDGLEELPRAYRLLSDYRKMNTENKKYAYNESVIEYHNYLISISRDPKKIMAHLYTWHMGDMFGGQAIKKIVPGIHTSLEFSDTKTLISEMRTRIDDSMAEEANVAFDWAIRMMREYDSSLEQNK